MRNSSDEDAGADLALHQVVPPSPGKPVVDQDWLAGRLEEYADDLEWLKTH